MHKHRSADRDNALANKNELFFLLDQIRNPALQDKNHLVETLKTICTVEPITAPIPAKFNISAIKAQYRQQTQYVRLFPTVFTEHNTKTPYKAHWHVRTRLKWAGLPFTVANDNFIHLKSLSYTKLSLLLQMLLYLSEQDKVVSGTTASLSSSQTTQFISRQLGATYSQGQLIDFIDRLYDQYKHTNLPADTFRHLFRCFGTHTLTIANAAFDHYIQSRNTLSAWHMAVLEFMQIQMDLPGAISQSLAKLLLNASQGAGS
ncbi:hypothetical protein SAMN06265379_103420 [Saccharicrinis carchari]|uniref:Uncharacterized protein n=1 Tax=Saccharicrinis carchari TaxID=1168039 RepID=A0A521CS75_SACCC|nr:hypothetical protein [Saccharicrinis carchari]SMO62282.1 hypothetical protein SAMN06265379_103420 [Saccharicrinis carchari]